MHFLVRTFLVGLTIVSSGFLENSALASNYSARRANSVKLVWRHKMGRHAYHTSRGARYSQHLGVKYSNNNDLPNVTWYTDAHEKLYNKTKHTSAIYYHVKSGDGRHGGWIWRGYLKVGMVNKANQVGSNGSGSLPADSTEGIAKKMIRNLGSGAHPDPHTMVKAEEILERSLNGKYKFLTLHELRPNNTYGIERDYVIIQNFNLKSGVHYLADKNQVTYLRLLMDSHVAKQDRSFEGGYYIENLADTMNLLRMYQAPHADFFGKKGLTRDNYFDDVKIGVAVAKLTKGKYATSVIFHYPEKFWNLVVDD